MNPFPSALERVVVIDIETTGIDPQRNGILEIGAVPLDPERQSEFRAEVRWVSAWWQWDAGAERVHGISPEQASSHRRMEVGAAIEELIDWIEDVVMAGQPGRAVLAGMNPQFDLGFLSHYARCCDLQVAWDALVSHRAIDMHSLAAARFAADLGAVERFPRGIDSLYTDAIYGLLGMEPEPKPHRALVGAQMEAEALRRLMIPETCTR